MVEFRRPSHRQIAGLLAGMDGEFLARANCYFGGGTQLALAHGEYRESRDVDFLVSSQDGIRLIRETVAPMSLGKLFKRSPALAREVMGDRDAVRTYLSVESGSDPIKFEIVYEARIKLAGVMDPRLEVPVLEPAHAIAEKLLANTDRGLDKVFRSRDVIDLAFASLDLDLATFTKGVEIAQTAYGDSVLRYLNDVIKAFELDAAYRRQCIQDLLIEDSKKLRQGIAKLRELRRSLHRARSSGSLPRP